MPSVICIMDIMSCACRSKSEENDRFKEGGEEDDTEFQVC